MALRADTIALPPGSPIGPCHLHGLREFDLVLVTGANGSGKTTLLSPLDAPGPTKGTVGCITDEGAQQNYGAQGVQRSITFIRSTQLLERFRDLSGALALAANTVRPRHEAQLLRQLATHAGAQESALDAAEPLQITQLKGAYLTADRACGARPRTAAEYNRLGAALAQRARGSWTHHEPCGASMERLAAEGALTPQPRNLGGLTELSQAVALLPAALAAPNPPTSAAARCEAAELALADSIEEAINELPEGDRPSPQPQKIDTAHALKAKLQDAARSMRAALEAKDALGQCRAVAARYLRTEADRGVAVDACPVCAHAMDAARVCAQLAAPATAHDPETGGWREKEARFDSLAGQLEVKARALEAARDQASKEHADLRRPIGQCENALRNSISQHARTVTEARVAIFERCRDWMSDFGDAAPSSTAVTAASALVVRARKSVEGLQAEERALNEGLSQAQQEFAAFQALGTALAMRASLDAAPWNLALDELQAARRRQAQRDRWINVLNRMAHDRETEARAAQATLVKDTGMQARFDALVSRIRHPSVQTLQYQGVAVTRAGAEAHGQLSEGQTALVNIAAAIAVAGKVAGAPGHPPGWIAFDEPTNGLDAEARQQVAEYLGSMTTQDLPCQLFVATFDEDFADRLQRAAHTAGRRVRRVRMQPFRPGQPCDPRIEDLLPN